MFSAYFGGFDVLRQQFPLSQPQSLQLDNAVCLVTVVDDLIRMGGSEQSDIRLFLDALDVRSDSWKDEAER